MVVDEQVVEENKREECCIGPPPLMMCIPLRLWLSIRVKQMSSWLGIIWIYEGTRRRCEPGRMSRGTPRRHEGGLIRVIIGLGCPLQFLLVRSRSMWPPLVHIIE